ncbi:hypothetical protein GCM10010343_23850 [Streptomyces avidinii]|nr:hypothetical protein GCM10010343_23850 [Streptomyces avidinii]
MTEAGRDEQDPSAFATARARLAADRADTLARAAALGRDFDGIVAANALVAVDDEHDPEGREAAPPSSGPTWPPCWRGRANTWKNWTEHSNGSKRDCTDSAKTAAGRFRPNAWRSVPPRPPASAAPPIRSGGHYPSDVAAGAAIGLAAAALVRAAPRLLVRHLGCPPPAGG